MQPLVRLSTSEPAEEGTATAGRVRLIPGSPPPTSSRLVLLVHGYNNTWADAAASYARFLELSKLQETGLAGQVCEFTWPGNKRWGILSFASYPFELAKACDSAALVYRYLKDLATAVPGGWELEVCLVCHSLGNRLAMETLRLAAADPQPGRLRFMTACWMAAAVREDRLQLGKPLRPGAELFRRSLQLFSGSDPVLHYAFPLGQTAGGDGLFPTAVGRFGQPETGLWTERGNMGLYGYGHSDYWPGVESTTRFRQFLGDAVGGTIPSAILPRNPPPASGSIASRALLQNSLPQPNAIVSRDSR